MRQVISLILALATFAAWAQEDLDAAKQSIEKWLETERLITKEEQDWRVGKEVLQERIDPSVGKSKHSKSASPRQKRTCRKRKQKRLS